MRNQRLTAIQDIIPVFITDIIINCSVWFGLGIEDQTETDKKMQ